MIPSGNPPSRTAQGDLDTTELAAMLQTIIQAQCGLSAIHHLLDEARTMSDIRARFVEWQAAQRKRPHH